MYFIDVQGTLVDENSYLIDGARDFIQYLNKNKIPYIVITNNTKINSDKFLDKLNDLGLDISKNNYLDPFMVLSDKVSLSCKIAPFGQTSFITTLEELGYTIDYNQPDKTVISIKEDYTNNDYANMIESALKSDIIAMHETSIYMKNNKKYPAVGAIAKMISYATAKPYQVVGKPSVDFYQKAKMKLKAKNFEDITIISDDMIGDLLGAKKLGMKTCFVLSGKIKDKNEIIPNLLPEQKPDEIFDSIEDKYIQLINN